MMKKVKGQVSAVLVLLFHVLGYSNQTLRAREHHLSLAPPTEGAVVVLVEQVDQSGGGTPAWGLCAR